MSVQPAVPSRALVLWRLIEIGAKAAPPIPVRHLVAAIPGCTRIVWPTWCGRSQ